MLQYDLAARGSTFGGKRGDANQLNCALILGGSIITAHTRNPPSVPTDWLFSKDRTDKSPSRAAGMDAEREARCVES